MRDLGNRQRVPNKNKGDDNGQDDNGTDGLMS
jgi:hypothetical protein